MRTTVHVEQLKGWANLFLSAPDSFSTTIPGTDEQADTRSQRLGVAGLLETVLHATGNYKGFRYLETELDDDGQLHDDSDQTRRKYF